MAAQLTTTALVPAGTASTGPELDRGPIRFLAHYVWRRKWLYLAVVSCLIGAAVCAVSVQYGMKMLVDAMATSARATAAVWLPLGIFLGFIAVENVLWRLGGWLGGKTLIGTGVAIRVDLFHYLSGHATRYFADHFAGALGNRVQMTAQAIHGMSATFFWQIVPPTTDFIGAMFLFFFVDWRMAVALLLFVGTIAGGLFLIGTFGRTLHRAYAERSSTVGGELVDALANIWAVKAFSARVSERNRLAERLDAEAGAHRRSWIYLEKTRIVHDIALWLMAGGMLAWAIQLWRLGSITPGEVVMVSALTFRILHGSRDMAFALINMTQDFSVIGECLRVIGQPHGVVDRPRAPALSAQRGTIEFEQVGFTHPQGRRVLDGFDLQVPAGQKVGIVGPSGAGKSTLISLVQRLDDIQKGRILIDGQDIASSSQDSLRAAIAVVPQDISLFHRSIMENIRYGRLNATDAEVIEAAKAAHCNEFIRELPRGYDTLVGERGAKLSGGQRQRVGLARAILKNAPILILDEATSALDTESEMLIQDALVRTMHGRTVLAVAHRLSTIADFDRVIVMMDGRIVEDGNPLELRRQGGIFDQLWRLQAESLALEDDRAAA